MVDAGYFFASVAAINTDLRPDSATADVTIVITAGREVRIDTLLIRGIPADFAPVLQEMRMTRGDRFARQDLVAEIAYLVDYFENRGYPFCKVTLDSLVLTDARTEGASLRIELLVDPGPLVLIGEIDVRGNVQTREHVIIRELRMAAGDVYSQKEVDKIPGELMRLGYFRWVNPPRLELHDNGSGRLIIELQEGSANKFDGILGYNPATSDNNGFISGFVNLEFGNLFGTGREVDANWERRSENSQQFRLRYAEPWILGFPFGAEGSIEQIIQDTSYVERKFDFGLNYIYNEHLSLFAQLGRRRISPDSAGVAHFGIPPSRSTDVGLAMTFNSLENPLNPDKGVVYSAAFQWSRKTVDLPLPGQDSRLAAFDQKRLSVDFEAYIPLFRFQVFALTLHGRQVTSDEPVVPITEQYRLGGSKSLRGYREEQFRGSRIAWSNLEYRFLFGRYARFFGFLDLGYFYREEAQAERIVATDAWQTGYGIGLRIDTKVGLFGVDYGLARGDSFSDGKVHVGLSNEF
jgi:outer membrane protein assembly factor BamA